MKRYRIIHQPSKKELATNAKLATVMIDRMIGLMFRKKMDGFDALIIEDCKSIHTCFMKYPIDVVFIDRKNKIVKIKNNIKPWRVTPIYFSASKAIEFTSGSVSSDFKIGDQLEVICIN